MKELYLHLYKAAKKHHFDIQKQFDNKELPDETYFILGLSDEIMVNTLNIILNYEAGSIESIGVDNSCRVVMEAISLLFMFKEDKISDQQVRLYRYQYSLVDNGNLASVLKKVGLGTDVFDRRINEDKETALDIYSEIFNVEKTELKKMIADRAVYLGDPLSFLKKKPKDDIHMTDFVNKYNPYDNMFVHLYKFFSIFGHPRYEQDLDTEKFYMGIREKAIDGVLAYVIEYFAANKYFVANDKELPTPHQDLFKNEETKDLQSNIYAIRYTFDELIRLFCEFDDGTDNMTIFFLSKMKEIAINMLITISLGYNEQTIAVYRTFMENIGTFNYINMAKDQEEMIHLKKAFWCTSVMQIDNCVEQMGINFAKTDVDVLLKPLYENYYKSKYKLSSYKEFKKNMENNSLYFFEKSSKNYNKLVRESLKGFSSGLETDDYYAAYKVAVDTAHASGYSFNATPIIIELYALRCVVLFWSYILKYSLLSKYTLAGHGIKRDISKPLVFIQEFCRYYNEEMLKIAKE